MKKLLGILVLGLFLSSNAYSAKTKFTKGQIYEGEINWRNKMKLNLPPGKWEVIEKWSWSFSVLTARNVTFAQMDGNRLIASFDIGEFLGAGKWIGLVAQVIYEVLFLQEHDGCYERSEYTLVKVFKRGMSYNCFLVQHVDVNKNLYHPDDPEMKIESAIIRKWIRENNVEVPKIMLCGGGGYFAPVVEDTLFSWDHCIDPEVFGASKNKFTTEDSSEYHPTNINRYPDKKKFMDDWIKLAAQRHKSFEMTVRAKEHHKLDLSKYGTAEVIEKTKTTISSSGLTEELKELHDLYKEGVLTKEEFEKAKKKLLN